ncbi:MAG: type 1 glutamine amidotransferase, partial [Thermacetogeniaceae bacterium]
MRLRICHLYPDLLNLYGDRGNVLILYQRAVWRGIRAEVDPISVHDRVRFSDYDIIFLGGGADQEQRLVSRDMEKKGPLLVEAAEDGVVILSICGGFQLLGRYYRSRDGSVLPGVGVFDVYTEAGEKRLKGNILLESSRELQEEMASYNPLAPSTLLGFENHSGRTFL